MDKNPSTNILEWINMHFNPVSKHLHADSNHQHLFNVQHNISICLPRESIWQFGDFGVKNEKISKFGLPGIYKYLFVQEFLIPPIG
jgi:hypothetical protein